MKVTIIGTSRDKVAKIPAIKEIRDAAEKKIGLKLAKAMFEWAVDHDEPVTFDADSERLGGLIREGLVIRAYVRGDWSLYEEAGAVVGKRTVTIVPSSAVSFAVPTGVPEEDPCSGDCAACRECDEHPRW